MTNHAHPDGPTPPDLELEAALRAEDPTAPDPSGLSAAARASIEAAALAALEAEAAHVHELVNGGPVNIAARTPMEWVERNARRSWDELRGALGAAGDLLGPTVRRLLDAKVDELAYSMQELEGRARALEELEQRPDGTEALRRDVELLAARCRGLEQERDQALASAQDEPLLGLATTRELVAELSARIEVHAELESMDVTAAGHPGHPERPVREAAGDLLIALRRIATVGDPRVLDYRTVDA